MCSWLAYNVKDDVNGKKRWVRGKSTPSYGTGPAKAQSGSYFMYLESSSPSTKGWMSNLTHPVRPGFKSVTFYYHMHGATMGTLRLDAYVSGTWQTLWSKSGQQQGKQTDNFTQAKVNLPSGAANMSFVAIDASSSYSGDMAIDSVVLSTTATPTASPTARPTAAPTTAAPTAAPSASPTGSGAGSGRRQLSQGAHAARAPEGEAASVPPARPRPPWQFAPGVPAARKQKALKHTGSGTALRRYASPADKARPEAKRKTYLSLSRLDLCGAHS